MVVSSQSRRPRLHVPIDLRAGVWANWSEVGFTRDEFTLHFARLNAFPDGPDAGILVARVNMSPFAFRDLLDDADMIWKEYARLSLPSEARDD
jgi:hypothetical protein